MTLLCCSTMLTTTAGIARAQCPTCDCPPVPTDDAVNSPANPPWQQCAAPLCVQIDACWASICYAYRCSTIGSPPAPCTNHDYVVTQVCVKKACFDSSGDSLSGLISKAGDSLMTNNPVGFPCPACTDPAIYWTESELSCWQSPVLIYNPSTGDTTEQFTACASHGWCLNEYKVCCGPVGGKTFTWVQSQNRAYECDSCTALGTCPPHH
jgi:hypothetical protein